MEALQRINTNNTRLPKFCLFGASPVSILAGTFLPAFSLAGCGSNSMGKSSTPSPVLATPPSSLTYETSALSATVGIPITPDPGAVSGGSSGLTFSVSPTLPPGLALDPSKGTVSGTPTAAAPMANYVVTVANSAGSTTATLTIIVVFAIPSNLAYASPVVNDTLGTAMPPDTPTVTGTISAFSIAPALPVGLTLDPSTGIIAGTPKAFSTPTVYTVTAENVSGSTTAQVTIAVNVTETVLLEQGHGGQMLAIRAADQGGPLPSRHRR
jgi:hypothetical protein